MINGVKNIHGTRPCDGRQELRNALLALHVSGGQTTAWDDISGAALNLKGVRQARLKGLAYTREKGVWKRISRQEVQRLGYKIVNTKCANLQHV